MKPNGSTPSKRDVIKVLVLLEPLDRRPSAPSTVLYRASGRNELLLLHQKPEKLQKE